MKEKVLKILHVIGYISMALLTLIFVVVGVNACNNTDDKQNDLQNQRALVREKYNVEEDRLYLRYEKITGEYDCRVYYSWSDSVDFCEAYINYIMNNYANDTTNNNMYLAIYGTDRNNIQTQIVKGYMFRKITYNQEGSVWDFYNEAGVINQSVTYEAIERPDYINFTFELYPEEGYYPVNNETFLYLKQLAVNYAGRYKESIEFLLPPYITFDKSVEPFYVNCAFKFVNQYFVGILYNGSELIFDGENYDLRFEKQYSLDGSQIFFDSGYDTYNDNKLRLTCFGIGGFQWLKENLLVEGEYYYNGKYYLNEQYIVQYIRTHNEWPSSGGFETHRYEMPFYSGGAFYTEIVVNYTSFSNSNNILVRVAYYNGANYDNVVLYRYYSNDTLTWEVRETDIKKVENYTIELVDTPLDNNNYGLFKTYYFLERIELKSNNDNGYIGNVFVLIGDSFASWLPILNIAILPGLTIGVLIFIPLVISLVLFVVWLFKR